ncbi:MAG: SpoIVB peptidase [Ruminococcaceae bacterium]|nr:SpoIVB peptidase [Oscillospiraceae bacterium]
MQIIRLAAAFFAAFTLTITASAKSLVPVGKTVAVKMFSDGVMVVGVEEGMASELEKGDVITHINDTEIDTVIQLKEIVNSCDGHELDVRVNRDGHVINTGVTPVTSDGAYKLGLWIRDSMAGIGTVTFYDPATGQFGALGHGVNDVDTGRLLPLEDGAIMGSEVASVKKGQAGTPGQLTGRFDDMTDIGKVTLNTEYGIFGVMNDKNLWTGETLETAKTNEIKNGPAQIISNVQGDEVQRFDVEIIKQNDSRDDRNMVIKVTDERLLAITGGIVQGMSGSPIIQDGKLVGAVTHVLVGDPTKGYGVYIENMIKHGEIV